MPDQIVRYAIPVVLIVHGIGHWMGILTAAGIIDTDNWNSRSWLLTDPLGDSVVRILAMALWAVAMLGFLAAGAGAWGWSATDGSWRTLAVVSAIISLAALALFWNAFAALIPNKVGSIGINVITLVAVLLLDWPSKDLIA